MIQRADIQSPPFDEIAARIATAFQPWRIVLFGSRARGDARDDSDYDLFVETEPGDASLRDLQTEIRHLIDAYRCPIDLHVGVPGQIERRRDDPGTLEWDVAREGILLYADLAAPPLPRTPGRVGEPRETPESVAEWVSLAEEDLRHLRHLFETGGDFWAATCFLAQQTFGETEARKAFAAAERIAAAVRQLLPVR